MPCPHVRSSRTHLAVMSSLIASVAMLLAWLGQRRRANNLVKAAGLIERALDTTIAKPKWRTGDLGGSTRQQGVRRAGGQGGVGARKVTPPSGGCAILPRIPASGGA